MKPREVIPTKEKGFVFIEKKETPLAQSSGNLASIIFKLGEYLRTQRKNKFVLMF